MNENISVPEGPGLIGWARRLGRASAALGIAAAVAALPALPATPAAAEGPIQFTVSTGGQALYHDAGTFFFQAILLDDTGGPIPNVTISFTIGSSLKCKAVTDATGTASCNVPNRLQPPPGNYTVTGHASGVFQGITATAPLNVDVGDSFIRLVNTPTNFKSGSTVTYTIRLEEGDGGPPPGPPIRGPFQVTINSMNSGLSQSCSGRTGRNGTGKCSIKVTLPPGPATIEFTWGPSSLYDTISATTAEFGQIS